MPDAQFPRPSEAAAHTLVASDLEAVFLPGCGMLGTSLRFRGEEILRRVHDLDAAAERGSSAGIPLLYPWANRLAGSRYNAAGHQVQLDPSSPILHFDEHGLPMHGIPWSRLCWEVAEATPDRLAARLDWDGSERLAVFPYRHRIELIAALSPDNLTLQTKMIAGQGDVVPICFGFHPYVGLPGLSRDQWRLKLPAMRRLMLDRQGIPTGEEVPFGGFDDQLGTLDLDDGFALADEQTVFSIIGAGHRISVELLAGYRYAQIFAPKGADLVAIEPMTAPTNALISKHGLRILEAGGEFRAAFRIHVEAAR